MTLTPMQAIRKQCLSCYNGRPRGVKSCPSTDCSLWYHRLGKRPTSENLAKNPLLDAAFFDKHKAVDEDTMIGLLKERKISRKTG